MDYEESDLSKIIKSGQKCGMNIDHIRNIMYNFLCAINFLSSANIIHRDLKPANILMNKMCQVKICDFGLARTIPPSQAIINSSTPKLVRENALKSIFQSKPISKLQH